MVTVYRLRCIHNDHAYIGCTAGKLGKRMREHRCLLNKQKHASQRLQSLWDLHGPSGFRLEPIETLPKGATVIEKRKRELWWMEHYDGKGALLNHSKCSFSPPAGAWVRQRGADARKANGYKPSPESNLKRRLAQLGKPKGHGAKISATKQAKKLTMR